jgi:hypothetical protein
MCLVRLAMRACSSGDRFGSTDGLFVDELGDETHA